MIITYLGKQFFKVQQGDLVIAFNPISKDSKLSIKAARFGADIALSSLNHPDYNGIDQLSHGETVPFAITGPGDYEVRDIFIKGIMSEIEVKGKKHINTIYTLSVDGISICFLGAENSKLSNEAIEAIDEPDILFLPIGGDGVYGAAEAYKMAVSLSPKIIIPMDYGSDKEKDSLKTFLKEGGEEKLVALDKLTIKRKDLEGKDGEIVLLSS